MDIWLSEIVTPLGTMLAGISENGLCMLEFENPKRIERHKKAFTDYDLHENKHHPLFKQLELELEEYFNRNRTTFSIPFDLIGTNFQKSVWNALLNIPYGVTRSYLEQSKEIGDINAVRAVANANGQNRISIIVPCHRVIGSNGSLTGYGGKLWRKKYLLALESNQTSLF